MLEISSSLALKISYRTPGSGYYSLAKGDYPEGLVYDMYDPYHYYRTQEIDGNKYLIVGGETTRRRMKTIRKPVS